MIKKSIVIGMMCVSFFGISQTTQCTALTKDSIRCKNITKSKVKLCYAHNPKHEEGKCIRGEAVICSGITKKGKSCKNRTKNLSGKCYRHED